MKSKGQRITKNMQKYLKTREIRKVVKKVMWKKLKLKKKMLKTGDQFPDYEVFTYWHAFFLVGAIVTYIVDLSLGKLSFLQFKSVKPLNVINLITLFLLITVHFSIRSYDLRLTEHEYS